MSYVIQIYKWVEIIEKPYYDTDARKRIGEWDVIQSTVGYVDQSTIFLPIEYKNQPDLKNPGLIIIQDIYGFNSFSLTRKSNNTLYNNWYFERQRQELFQNNRQSKGFSTFVNCNFEIFRFKKNEEDGITIELHAVDNIGVPKREAHKIGVLDKPGASIRYKTNGKSDGWTNGKQRLYTEFDYVINFLGVVDKIEFKELNRIEKTKEIPAQYKLIDERKILY